MKIKTQEREFEINFKGSVLSLLKVLNLSPVEFLVIVNGELTHESKLLKGNENVIIFPVVKGG